MDMAGRIKERRTAMGYTQEELGEKIGVTEATAQKYEAGNIKKIDVEMLKKISDALGTTPEKLTGWESKAQYEEYRAKKTRRRRSERNKNVQPTYARA